MDGVALLTIFVLSIFVGFEVVSKVSSTLHTPLMSETNAISSVIAVGALLAVGVGLMGDGGPLWAHSPGRTLDCSTAPETPSALTERVSVLPLAWRMVMALRPRRPALSITERVRNPFDFSGKTVSRPRSAVAMGVPSASDAQVLDGRSPSGSARSWRRMPISSGTAILRPWRFSTAAA